MQSILIEKLRAYILVNNPDLAVKLQADYSVTQYLEDKVMSVTPLLEGLLLEGKPGHIIEELCLLEMTTDLRPSRFNYIKSIIEEEFIREYEQLLKTGVLTYECITLVKVCSGIFDNYDFSEATEDNRFLRYSIIAAIAEHFN